jgi:2-polyprenyl-3-methyl-5-hydroxy-6-metoxy-1,4-benzoquinol methylase
MNKSHKTIKTNEYRQLLKKPSTKELENYYKLIYFQQTKGSFKKHYTKAELVYLHNNLELLSILIKRVLESSFNKKKFLDLGAGEGWALNYFNKLGCIVTGVDLSSFAIEKFNKPMKKFFNEEEINSFIGRAINNKYKYDIINITNVIEHVLDPEILLCGIKKILKKRGVICVTFPNDYSPLQKKLFVKGKIRNAFWVSYPDHISYFNKKSFSGMSKRLGLKPVIFIADFPIDLFLLNDNSNYIVDKTKGKEAHFSRVDFINLICKLDKNTTSEFLLKLGEIGLGRNLTAILKAR